MSDETKRAEGYEDCPGCVAVVSKKKLCAPGNLSYCTASQGNASGWTPGACVGCLQLADGKPCASGNARICAVAALRNR